MASATSNELTPEQLDAWSRSFAANVPHNHALGIVFVEVTRDGAHFRLPYADHLVGNPETGVLHGGVITALLDACCGAAVFAHLTKLQPIATLDLRIDYMRPAEPLREVNAHAVCYHLTRNVAFARASAFHDDVNHPIATAAATFMLGTKRGKATP